MQLFCFTYAGGTAAFFNQLEAACAGKIDFVKLEYPGHGLRRKENLCDAFQDLVADSYVQLRENYLGGDYALLGYSMGSIAALESLRYLMGKGELPCPRYVFMAAHEPRMMLSLNECSSENMDEYVKNRTILFGGVPEQLLDNECFWRIYLPLYKADYLMMSRYDFDKLAFSTEIPAMFFYSEQDTPRAAMEPWKKYFTGSCEFVAYSGNHFFIREHYREMAALIRERLGV
ncbi:MAG: thioesterase [Lachnospiraceae bacterium]|jgi:medium-chain acyl-[acyl-carrier-protein] hydrolase|nr:thioesterase [Lachnospiraceae bacterium]